MSPLYLTSLTALALFLVACEAQTPDASYQGDRLDESATVEGTYVATNGTNQFVLEKIEGDTYEASFSGPACQATALGMLAGFELLAVFAETEQTVLLEFGLEGDAMIIESDTSGICNDEDFLGEYRRESTAPSPTPSGNVCITPIGWCPPTVPGPTDAPCAC